MNTPKTPSNQDLQYDERSVEVKRLEMFPQVSIPMFLNSAIFIILFIIYEAMFSEHAGQLFSTI